MDDPAQVARRHYFPAVEGMRAVAALTVLFGHVLLATHPSPIYGTFYDLGQRIAPMGVYVFFAISGFLIYRPFVAARARGHSVARFTPGYIVRRAVRILPAYWVAITLLAIWPGSPGVHDVFGDHWWAVYGLLQIYSPNLFEGVGLTPAWTLCVELSFYMVLPLVALLLQNRGVHSGDAHGLRWEVLVIGSLAIASFALRTIFFPDIPLSYLAGTLLGTFGWFCAGMLLAAIEQSPGRFRERLSGYLGNPAFCWPLAGVLLLIWIASDVPEPLERQTLATLGEAVQVAAIAGLLLAPAVFGDRRPVVSLGLSNRTMVYLGTISYGIYLYHWPIAEWLSHREAIAGLGGEGYVLAELVIVLASLSWFLIEKPLMTRVRSVKALKSPSPHVDRPAKAIAEPAP